MRCNLILPNMLTDQHLIAERNELRFIPPLLEKKYKRQGMDLVKDIPEKFCLGKGHMCFWLDKFLYLETRYKNLSTEMLRRNFKPDLTIEYDVSLAKELGLYNDWEESYQDRCLIKERIKQRILLKPAWYRYNSMPITLEWVRFIYGD